MIHWVLGGRLIGSIIRDVLKDQQMDGTVFSIVLTMWLHESDEPMTVSDVERLMVVSQSGISRALLRAEREGLVRKSPNPADARSVVVELTDIGRTQADELISAAASAFDQRLGSPDAPDTLGLVRAAESVVSALDATDPSRNPAPWTRTV
jgi:DNA-binding MarR family transcriptional regulator